LVLYRHYAQNNDNALGQEGICTGLENYTFLTGCTLLRSVNVFTICKGPFYLGFSNSPLETGAVKPVQSACPGHRKGTLEKNFWLTFGARSIRIKLKVLGVPAYRQSAVDEREVSTSKRMMEGVGF
jgi:hypothetical protein